MTCPHCVARVEKAILDTAGVTVASVQLDPGRAQVSGGLPHAVIAAIEAAGYHARPQVLEPDFCELPAQQRAASESAHPKDPGGYRIAIEDMTCASCVTRVEQAILAVNGVSGAAVNLVEGAAYVHGGDPQQVVNAVIDQGYPAHLPMVTATAPVMLGFSQTVTDSDRHTVETAISAIDGAADLYWIDNRKAGLTLHQHPADYLLALRQAGFDAHFVEATEDPYARQAQEAQRHIRQSVRRAALAGSAGFALMGAMLAGVLPPVDSASPLTDLHGRGLWSVLAAVCLLIMLYSGRSYYTGAWKQLRHGQANMDTLVAVGTAAAWLASLLLILAPDFVPAAQRHLYLETSIVILAFLQFGHALEIRAKSRTGRAIGALLELAPKTARLLYREQELTVPVSLLQPGDHFLVKSGDAIATDARVTDGRASVDESMLTGESLAVIKQAGDALTGGTINQSGVLTARVERVGDATTLAGIIRAVKQAQLSKPPIGRLVDRVAAVFVPVVLVIALLTFLAWYLFGPSPQLPYAITTAVAVLVIACPCALGLATPIAIMVGMGRAAQLGILIRNGAALQSAAGISHLVMDKTGTLTEGHPRVTDIYCAPGMDESRALGLAASLEKPSEHPLAQAVVASAIARGLSPSPVSAFHNEAGLGVSASIDARQFYLGSDQWLTQQHIRISPELNAQAQTLAGQGITPIWLADQQHSLALLGLRDPVRADTPAALRQLRALGIELVMCTGDAHSTAQAIARELGIDTVHSRVLPASKADVVKQLQDQGHSVGMVGDGINDAPALSQAQVGFAIGAGTDIAIESADVTLSSNSLISVANAVALSRATLTNIKQNLLGAFIYNVAGIPLAAGIFYPVTGWLLNPVFASLAMALSSVTVVSNANRLRLFKPEETEK
jgi:Cu+-exporting ATPase